MSGVARALHRFWFRPEAPLTMPLARVVLCLHFVRVLLPTNLRRLAEAGARPAELLDPSPVLAALPIPFPLPASWLAGFGGGLTALGICAAVGIFTRPALLLFVVGNLYAGAAIAAWGYMPHATLGILHVLAVLAFAPGTDAWSADRALAWAWSRRRGAPAALRAALAGPPVPRWGTQLVLAVFATLFFAAGVSKVRHGGLRWVDGQTLGFYLAGGTSDHIPDARGDGEVRRLSVWTHGFSQLAGPRTPDPAAAWRDGFGLEGYTYHTTPTPLGRTAARHTSVLVALSVATVVFELAAPLVLCGPLLRNLYLLTGIAFFAGIELTMPVRFTAWVPVFLSVMDWRWIFERARALSRVRGRRAAPPVAPSPTLAEV